MKEIKKKKKKKKKKKRKEKEAALLLSNRYVNINVSIFAYIWTYLKVPL